ncbi:hypothetical protein K438DRAFT_1749045 [Mycena galopus ATCC 62051]|nr:hypothetical protein K438DRAFT_1749045 [Mycena galopus ATCC 62051]
MSLTEKIGEFENIAIPGHRWDQRVPAMAIPKPGPAPSITVPPCEARKRLRNVLKISQNHGLDIDTNMRLITIPSNQTLSPTQRVHTCNGKLTEFTVNFVNSCHAAASPPPSPTVCTLSSLGQNNLVLEARSEPYESHRLLHANRLDETGNLAEKFIYLLHGCHGVVWTPRAGITAKGIPIRSFTGVIREFTELTKFTEFTKIWYTFQVKDLLHSAYVLPIMYSYYMPFCAPENIPCGDIELTGTQAAWIAKKFPGHRTYPASILEQLDVAGIN